MLEVCYPVCISDLYNVQKESCGQIRGTSGKFQLTGITDTSNKKHLPFLRCLPSSARIGYDNRRQLMKHNRDHHGPKLYCPCGIDFPCSRRYRFVEHQRVCQAVPRTSQMLPSLLSLNVLLPQSLVQSVPTVLSTASTSTVPQFLPDVTLPASSTAQTQLPQSLVHSVPARYLYCHYL